MGKPISLPVVEYGGKIFCRQGLGCCLRNVIFVETHQGSPVGELVSAMNANHRILIRSQNASYEHPDSLDWLFASGHKDLTSAALYGDIVVESGRISCEAMFSECKFLFVLSEPQSMMAYMETGISEEAAARAYGFRLRRMCETARRVRHGGLVTADDLRSGRWSAVANLITGKEIESRPIDVPMNRTIGKSTMSYAIGTYERHLRYIRSLKHIIKNDRQAAPAENS